MPLAHIQEKSSDQSFLMPARIFNPRQEEPDRIEVPMIIDTGSARTAIPQRAYLQLTSRVPLLYGLTNMKMKSPLMPEETISTPSYIVILEFQLGEHTKTHEVEVFTISRDYGIICRDIINQYKIVLDAPEKKWGIDCRWQSGITCDEHHCIKHLL